LINMDKWKSLTDAQRRVLEVACGESIHNTYAETEAVNPGAMVEMGEKFGVKTMRWRDDQLAVFEQAWLDVLAEDAQKDAKFKEVADSYLAFRKSYSKWGQAQALKATYLK